MPTVSNRPASRATPSLVPTPSVEATSTGARYPDGISNRPPKLPRPPITSGRAGLATRGWMSDTARSPESMSTPAASYVRGAFPGTLSVRGRGRRTARSGARRCGADAFVGKAKNGRRSVGHGRPGSGVGGQLGRERCLIPGLAASLGGPCEYRLREPDRHRHRVIAGEAGVAEAGPRDAGRLFEGIEGEVRQAVGP